METNKYLESEIYVGTSAQPEDGRPSRRKPTNIRVHPWFHFLGLIRVDSCPFVVPLFSISVHQWLYSSVGHVPEEGHGVAGRAVGITFGAVPFVHGGIQGLAEEFGHDAELVAGVPQHLEDLGGPGTDFARAIFAAVVLAQMHMEEVAAAGGLVEVGHDILGFVDVGMTGVPVEPEIGQADFID